MGSEGRAEGRGRHCTIVRGTWEGKGGWKMCSGNIARLSPACLSASSIFPVIFKEEPLPDSSLRGFPPASGPPFGADMDFSPPRPPYPTYPHEDPAYETPYLSEGFGYGTPPLYPQTGAPTSYRPGLHMFPETGDTTGCAHPPSVSFLPRPFPSDLYGGRGSSFPLGLPFPPPAPFRSPLPSSPPPEGPFPSQSSVPPLPAEGYNEVGPGYGPGEGTPEQEKSRGGYSSSFRDSVPIQGITLEEGGCELELCVSMSVRERSACLLRARA